MLFAAVNVARKLQVDPELALRASTDALPRARRGRRGGWPPRPAADWDDAATPERQARLLRPARLPMIGTTPTAR